MLWGNNTTTEQKCNPVTQFSFLVLFNLVRIFSWVSEAQPTTSLRNIHDNFQYICDLFFSQLLSIFMLLLPIFKVIIAYI